jgi:two-component system sensor histidine kinase PilS (NtrC family)
MLKRLIWASGMGPGHVGYPPVGEALQWLMLARLGMLYLLLMVGVVQQVLLSSGGGPGLVVSYSLLAAAFAFNSLAALGSNRARGWWQPAVHIVFDAVLISIWIFFSAGKENLYSLLYLVQILFVALILYQRAAFLAALSATVGFGIVLMLQPPAGVAMVWGLNVALFLTLGIVGGYLSEELHRTSVRLAEKSEKVDKLIALQERILSHMPTGLITVDGQNRIGFLNPAASSLLGLSSINVVGKTLGEVFPGLLPFFKEIPRLQLVVEVELQGTKHFLRGDVAMLDVASAGSLFHAEATEGRVLLFQDVTKTSRLEERLKQNEKLAAVGQLAAGIAHEIRNPLAGMSASIELLRSSLPPEVVKGEDQKLMDIALREIARLNQLITEFLDYVKPNKLKLESVDLSKQISEVLFALRHPERPGYIKSLKGGIVVRTDIELKETYDAGALALANNEKLKQVIWNLVINAIQAMDKPGTIEVGCAREGEQRVKFWVRDHGLGMNEKTLSHLYEPFFTTKEKGTGLGLATAYKIVESFNGEIRVESAVGQGTRFEIFLPAA